MTREAEVDRLIREALRAEDLQIMSDLDEPSLPDAVTAIFRGRMRVYGAMFLFMILVFFVLTIVCAVQFLGADDAPEMIRWGVGFLFCVMTVMSGKTWWWMQVERIAMIREIKRVELLVAQLAAQLGRG
jgi:hypothetical protein